MQIRVKLFWMNEIFPPRIDSKPEMWSIETKYLPHQMKEVAFH